MTQHTMISPTTAAVLYSATTAPIADPFDSHDYAAVTLVADNLATTEEVDIYVAAGNSVKVAADSAGTAYKLTATAPQITLEGGPVYTVSKDATASACSVVALPQNY